MTTGAYAIAAEPDRESWYPFTAYPDIHCINDAWQIFDVAADLSDIDFAIARGGRIEATFPESDGSTIEFGQVAVLNYLDEQGNDLGWNSFGSIEAGILHSRRCRRVATI